MFCTKSFFPGIGNWIVPGERDQQYMVLMLITGWIVDTWWRHQMETFSTLLAICAGNSPLTGEFSAQRPVTQSFGVLFDPWLNKRLSKQSWGWWFEMPSRSLWRHSRMLATRWLRLIQSLMSEMFVYVVTCLACICDGTSITRQSWCFKDSVRISQNVLTRWVYRQHMTNENMNMKTVLCLITSRIFRLICQPFNFNTPTFP